MKRIFATTALVALTAMPVVAETGMTDTKGASYTTGDGNTLRVSNLMNRQVYIQRGDAAETNWTDSFTDAPDSWENVAEIQDILVSADGEIASVILDAGGFLGIDSRQIRIPMDDLRMVPDADEQDAYFVVYSGDRQLIEQSEEYDAATAQIDGYTSAIETHDTANASWTDMDKTKMSEVQNASVSAEQLEGIAIYGPNDERVGEISDMVVNADGTVEQLIVDVGGFLGVGEKQVSLDFSQVRLMKPENDDALSAFVSMTEEELAGMSNWEAPVTN